MPQLGRKMVSNGDTIDMKCNLTGRQGGNQRNRCGDGIEGCCSQLVAVDVQLCLPGESLHWSAIILVAVDMGEGDSLEFVYHLQDLHLHIDF